MRPLLSYARSTSWIIGIVQLLIGPYIIVAARSKPGVPVIANITIVLAGATLIALGALSCWAASLLGRSNKPHARPVVAINSIFSLAMFPFGTIAGAVGLYWCCSRKMRELEPVVEDFEHQSLPGDGTQRWVQKAAPVAGIIIWIAALSAAMKWGDAHGLPRRGPLNGLVLLFVCEWIAVFFHELGHTLAGWAVGMKLASFTVGPFRAQKRAGKWQFRPSFVGLLNEGGGMSSCPLYLGQLRRRMAFEVAGGPVASLLTTFLAFTVLLAIPGSEWEAWWKVPAVVAAMSGISSVLNLVPFRAAAGFSDGALLVQLLRGGPFADFRETLKMVGATMVSTTRPRELDPRALSHGMRAGLGSAESWTLHMIQLICAVDRGELDLARECLDSSLKLVPAPEKARDPGCAAELTFYVAYLDGNAKRAAEWLEGVERMAAAQKFPLSSDVDYWRAVTAVRLAEGRQKEADEAYTRAMQISRRRPAAGIYEFDRELLDKVYTGEWIRHEEQQPLEHPELAQLAEALQTGDAGQEVVSGS